MTAYAPAAASLPRRADSSDAEALSVPATDAAPVPKPAPVTAKRSASFSGMSASGSESGRCATRAMARIQLPLVLLVVTCRCKATFFVVGRDGSVGVAMKLNVELAVAPHNKFVLCRRSRSSEPWHPSTNDWNVQIEKDLHRTFPGHPLMNRRGRGTLRRILAAYSRRNDAVGYCQVVHSCNAAEQQRLPAQPASRNATSILMSMLLPSRMSAWNVQQRRVAQKRLKTKDCPAGVEYLKASCRG